MDQQQQRIGQHARLTFNDVENAGEATRPLDFPPPLVHAGVRVTAFVIHPATDGQQDVIEDQCTLAADGREHAFRLHCTRTECK